MGQAAEQEPAGQAANEEKSPSRLEQLKEQDSEFLIKRCADAVNLIKSKQSERSGINADIKAKREELESLGITKQAFALAVKVSDMSEDQLDGFWLALQIMLKAVDRPIRVEDVQQDLFEDS